MAAAEEVQATISLGSVSEEENEEEEQEIEEEEPPIPPVVTCQGEIATIVGTPGDDRGDNAVVGTEARDVIAALEGDDEIQGLGGDDLICGDEGY